MTTRTSPPTSAAPPSRRVPPARLATGALRLILGLGLAVAVGVQIGDRAVNGVFDPWEYFSYFTIQTTLFNVVVLVAGGILALRLTRDTVLYTVARMAALAYAIVTFGVFNLLLRDDGPAAPGVFVPIGWPSEVMHVWVPILLVIDWLLSPGRPSLPWRSLWIVPIYPVVWALYSFGRAAASGGTIYPYPFLDPATDGWGSVFGYIVGLTLVLVALGALAVLYARWAARVRERG